MRKIELIGVFIGLLLFFSLIPELTAGENASATYSIAGDGTLILVSFPGTIDEGVIYKNIEIGHKSEIYISYRVQMSGGSLSIGGEHLELHIRKTGFRDQITGDYILLLNEREIGVYQIWEDFFKSFSSYLVYPAGIPVTEGSHPMIRVRQRVIYKKLVSPFSLLYILPGKFIHTGKWINVVPGELP